MSANRRSAVDQVAVGVDGCPGGWIAAVLRDGNLSWRQAAIGGFADLVQDCLAGSPEAGVLAVDMPVGLVEVGWRTCDVQAKALLGKAHMRVFLTPPREIVHLGLQAPNAKVQERCRELTGQGISRQALALSSRILDVDRCLPDPRIIEAHPELSFTELAGRVLASKHRPEGVLERIAALDTWGASTGPGDMNRSPDAPEIESALASRPDGIPLVDALDALAVAWTAERHLLGHSRHTPTQPPVDARGVPMSIIT